MGYDNFTRLRNWVRDPLTGWMKICGVLSPERALDRHSDKARRAGLRGINFILSFDCDTELDFDVAERVNDRLGEMGIRPVYAVPGELLLRGLPVYRRLREGGAEFINHGFRSHTEYDRATKEYVSTIFYDQLGASELEEDVRRGHATLIEALGVHPTGFRTPHFGTFQSPGHLRRLHRLLDEMGYRFSTSTMPVYGLLRGPVYAISPRLLELAVTGGYHPPHHILDSWTYRYAGPAGGKPRGAYLAEIRRVLHHFESGTRPALLNYYADPSQVHDWEEFFEAMSLLAKYSLNGYDQLLDKLSDSRKELA